MKKYIPAFCSLVLLASLSPLQAADFEEIMSDELFAYSNVKDDLQALDKNIDEQEDLGDYVGERKFGKIKRELTQVRASVLDSKQLHIDDHNFECCADDCI